MAPFVDFLIVGTPRSGTTLVQRLASELPGVRVPHETHFLERFALDLVRRFRFPLDRAELERALAAYMALPWMRDSELDPADVVRRLGGGCASVRSLFAAIVRSLAGDAPLCGEKTPGHLYWWRALAGVDPRVRIVGVVRDPRAAVCSNLERRWSPSLTHVHLAELWSIEQRELARAARSLGPRCLVLRYEDVVADPDAARAALAGFLGAPSAAPAARAPERLFLPWETWKENALGAIDPGRAERWRGEMTPSQQRDVAAICRREMERFDYRDELPGACVAIARRCRIRPGGQAARWVMRLEAASRRRAVRAVLASGAFGS
jgi:hypothetical protein